jgi:hypothetical protein
MILRKTAKPIQHFNEWSRCALKSVVTSIYATLEGLAALAIIWMRRVAPESGT